MVRTRHGVIPAVLCVLLAVACGDSGNDEQVTQKLEFFGFLLSYDIDGPVAGCVSDQVFRDFTSDEIDALMTGSPGDELRERFRVVADDCTEEVLATSTTTEPPPTTGPPDPGAVRGSDGWAFFFEPLPNDTLSRMDYLAGITDGVVDRVIAGLESYEPGTSAFDGAMAHAREQCEDDLGRTVIDVTAWPGTNHSGFQAATEEMLAAAQNVVEACRANAMESQAVDDAIVEFEAVLGRYRSGWE